MRGRINKSIAIIGEGETEWFYFDSLRIAKRYPFRLVPGMPSHSDFGHILSLADRYLKEKFDYVICLIDMDRMKQLPAEMTKYQAIKRKREYKSVWFIETHPCTEFPDLSKRKYISYDDLLPELQRYMPGYEKTKRYFRKTDLYTFLEKNGDIERAVRNGKLLSELSKSNPDDEICYSEVYKVIEIITLMIK
jgi:hypothetical protein